MFISKINQEKKNIILGAFFGTVVGDAIGVPVEFCSREELISNPVVGMRGHGTHNQEPGTWSDDSSLWLATAYSIIDGYNLKSISKEFIDWKYNNKWTANGNVFDIGTTTYKSIERMKLNYPLSECGMKDERSNGNGSLMRIIPITFYVLDKSIDERFKIVSETSSLTHAHPISIISCFILSEFCRFLIINNYSEYKTVTALEKLNLETKVYLHQKFNDSVDMTLFDRIFDISNNFNREEYTLSSTGYVLDTLECSIWSAINANKSRLDTREFRISVLHAVNLGGDTDTIASITGGISGIINGYSNIPDEWINAIKKKNEIYKLAIKFYKRFRSNIQFESSI